MSVVYWAFLAFNLIAGDVAVLGPFKSQADCETVRAVSDAPNFTRSPCVKTVILFPEKWK